MGSFKQMMIGAGAQATLLGTDIQSMGDKFSSMAMRSTLMERQLASTGITMEELGSAMGMTGATADEVKAKWQELDTNQRAAALGMAASMNEGQTANEEYKKSWAGLQEQLDIAKGRLERLAGEVLLPVLIPALEVAGRVLNWLGDTISMVMKGPLGGLISVVGAAAAAFALAVPAIMAIKGAMGLYTASLAPAITATWELLAPWLPFIAIGAAIVLLIYEIGKAFGWWTDVSSMIDSIWAGVMRLWSAFINHPDVQGFLSALTAAWNWLVPAVTGVVNAVLRFFGVSSSSKFDFVRALIDALGGAWNQMTFPIRLVITVVKLFITTMVNVSNRVKAIINGIKNLFARLPGAIRGAISSLTSIITHPVQTARNIISGIVGSIKSTIQGITGVNIGSLTSKLTQPVTNAYNNIAKTVSNIIKKIKSIPHNIPGLGGAFGFDYEGMLEELESKNKTTTYTRNDENLSLDHNINFSFDFTNLPEGTSEETLVAMLRSAITDRSVINSLVNSPDFQSLDGKVKDRLLLKGNRARGV
jgi:phage-related protein